MRFGETVLSVGTCFFWQLGGEAYLVTNWHNLSGINPLTGRHLSSNGGEPDRVSFGVFLNKDPNTPAVATVLIENEAGPLWLEHPRHRRQVDVVCLKLPDNISPHTIAMNSTDQQSLVTRIADDVFILGFPLGIGPEGLPIWKRASVASEPDFDIDQLPKFLVDTATASGMSGSPVIAHTISGPTEWSEMVMFTRPESKFLGVYSGRLTTGNSLEAQLGVVWKARVVAEIIEGGVRGARRE